MDTVCNFLGDEWFIMDLAEANQFDSSKRTPWFYQQSSKYISQIGGYHQNFSNGNINIDLITVKVSTYGTTKLFITALCWEEHSWKPGVEKSRS